MARTFDGTDDRVTFGSETAVDDLTAFTSVALVRRTGAIASERQILTKMGGSFTGSMYLAATGDGTNNNKLIVVRTGGSTAYAESVADAIPLNAWAVAVSVWPGDAVRPKLYLCTLGGTLAELSYVSQTAGLYAPSDASAAIMVGGREAADATYFAGGLAECAVWNRVLADDELRALGCGFAPEFFPRGRVFYSRIDGRHSPEINMAGTTHGTVTGTTFLDHPPVIYPRQMVVQVPTVGGSSFKAAWARGANVVIGSGAR